MENIISRIEVGSIQLNVRCPLIALHVCLFIRLAVFTTSRICTAYPVECLCNSYVITAMKIHGEVRYGTFALI